MPLTLILTLSSLMQGKANGKVGYFPAKYVEKVNPGEKVLDVVQGLEISEGDTGIKLLKDQVRGLKSIMRLLPSICKLVIDKGTGLGVICSRATPFYRHCTLLSCYLRHIYLFFKL